MGKMIDDQEYRLAVARLNGCYVDDCRNHTRKPEDNFCQSCKSSFKVKKEYERKTRGQVERS